MHITSLVSKCAVAKCAANNKSHPMNAFQTQYRNFSKRSNDGSNNIKKHSFMNPTSSCYVEEIFKSWQRNPSSVHASWDSYFRNTSKETSPSILKRGVIPANSASGVGEAQKSKLKKALIDVLDKKRVHDEVTRASVTPKNTITSASPQSPLPPNVIPPESIPPPETAKKDVIKDPIETSNTPVDDNLSTKPEPVVLSQKRIPQSSIASAPPPPPTTIHTKGQVSAAAGGGGGGGAGGAPSDIEQHLAVQGVIRSYQARGHLVAQLDPLGILYKDKSSTVSDRYGSPPEEVTQHHKDKLVDMNKKFILPATTFIAEGQKTLELKEIIKRLELAYCRHIGVEYLYINNTEEVNWLRQKFEPPGIIKMTKEEKIRLLKRIARATMFENFTAKKWSSEKRFGLEGGDVAVAMIKQIIDTATDHGLEAVNFCMAHRGRLNVLTNVCRKPLADMFIQFEGIAPEDEGSGDVKYHLGLNINRVNSANNKKIRLCVVANPSHLECSSAVCLGKTKCEQFLQKDEHGVKTMAILIHGDAAFSGQGIVYECLNLSYLPAYTTHGSIRIVINNQVGYTTDPRFSRSSPYCTDVGRVVQAPIFHVNGDDPESVMHVAKVAAEWRQKFHKDVVIDLVCYRRNGHNELDEPMFTQPLMYQKIRKHPTLFKMYSDQMINEKVITQAEIDAYVKEYAAICDDGFAKAKEMKTFKARDWLDSPWKGFFKNFKFDAMPKTGISEADLMTIAKKFSTEPPNFEVHKGFKRIIKGRLKMVAERKTDWAFGEALAYTSLMKEGVHVRLSGQDVERGTFAHRHCILHHQSKDKEIYNMMENTFPKQAPFTICNSALSEFGVAGFELGYCQCDPHILAMWEAQFGDFSNGAQIIFDQYLSSGQAKWIRQSALVLNLPHAMEGMGPEHSSARLERFLQMCDDDVDSVKPPFDLKFVLNQHFNINWFVANCTTPGSLFHLLRRQMKLPFRKPLVLMTPKGLLRDPKASSKFEEFLEGTEFQRMIPDIGPASKAPDNVKKLIFCSGRTYYHIVDWAAAAKVDSQIAVARLEQISPFSYDLVAAEMKKFPKAKVYWSQEEHKNHGSWSYVKDRINAASEGKVKVEYIGRPVAAAPATGNKTINANEIKNYKAAILKMP